MPDEIMQLLQAKQAPKVEPLPWESAAFLSGVLGCVRNPTTYEDKQSGDHSTSLVRTGKDAELDSMMQYARRIEMGQGPMRIEPSCPPEPFDSRTLRVFRDFLIPQSFNSGRNFDLNRAVLAASGEFIDHISQHVVHVLSHTDVGQAALGAIGYAFDGLRSAEKGVLKFVLSKDEYKSLAAKYHSLSHGEKILLSCGVDSAIMARIGGALKMTKPLLIKSPIEPVFKSSVKQHSVVETFKVKPSLVGEVVDLSESTGFHVHKNSHSYTGETHVYRIWDPEGMTFKIGESARGLNAEGQSIRATEQTKKLWKETGRKFESDVRQTFDSKKAAYDYEGELIKRFRGLHGSDKLPGNKGNH